MPKVVDILGRRFGRLVVEEKTNLRTKQQNVLWRCRCDCGKTILVRSYSLEGGGTKSCGCYRDDHASIKNWPLLSRQKIAASNVKRGQSAEARAKVSAYQKGRPKSLEQRLHMRDGARKGPDSHLWKGGISPEHAKIRASFEYADWRRKVFRRDNFKCVVCGVNDNTIKAHHILPFAKYEHLRFTEGNGVTLCEKHHDYVHRTLRKMKCA